MNFDAVSYELGRQQGGGGGSAVIQSITITENGTTTAPSGVDGFAPITVAVPIPTPTLQNKSISANGTYTADQGYDGLGEVVVNVSGGAPIYNLTGNIDSVFAGATRKPWFEAGYTNLGTITGIDSARATFMDSNENIGNKTIALITTGDGANCNQMFDNFNANGQGVMPTITGKIGRAIDMFRWARIDTADLSGTTYDQYQYGDAIDSLPIFKNNFIKHIVLPSSMSFRSASWAFGNAPEMISIDDTNTTFTYKNPQGWGPGGSHGYMFWASYRLRELPMNFINAVAAFPIEEYGTYNMIYYYMCQHCRSLNKIVNLPVVNCSQNDKDMTSAFDGFVDGCNHLSRFTFATTNMVNWERAFIRMGDPNGYGVGYGSAELPIEKKITDAASYAALKNDPDAWTEMIEYSRYDHDSAAETLASLPLLEDTEDGSIISFYGNSGSLTDAGAINTLTSAEIAVATANGWTVSFQ